MPASRRILLIAHDLIYGDGQARINLEIARRALLRGLDLTIVSMTIDEQLLKMGAVWYPLGVRRRPVLARVFQFAHKVDRFLNERVLGKERFAIIANGFTTTRPHDLNLCQFVHAAWGKTQASRAARGMVDRLYQRTYTRYNANREKIAYASARHIVTPSHRTAAELSAIGVPLAKIEIIPNGVDMEEFRPGPGDRQAIGVARNVPLLLFAGDLRTNRKGLRWVLQAIKRLPHVHLAVIGRVEGSIFPAMAHSLDIGHRVHFLGFRRDVADIMRACDLFVFPSAYEPFGMVVTEALSSGLPVVTSAATGASELVNDGCGTVLADADDVEGIARAIVSWLEPGRITSAAGACRRAVVNHTWTCMADGYLNRLATLTQHSGAGDAQRRSSTSEVESASTGAA